MWAAFALSACLLAADPAEIANQGTAVTSASPEVNRRPYHELDKELRQLLRSQVEARSDVERAAIIVAQCKLHAEIVSDPRLELSNALQSYRNELATRLRKTLTSLKHQMKRSLAKDSPSVKNPAAGGEFIPEQEQSLAVALQLTDFSLASPQQFLASGGAAQQDLGGAALVDLIERTLNPQFWERAGGPGRIVYYAPLQCLVVRATGEMHEQTAGVLGNVRKAGK